MYAAGCTIREPDVLMALAWRIAPFTKQPPKGKARWYRQVCAHMAINWLCLLPLGLRIACLYGPVRARQNHQPPKRSKKKTGVRGSNDLFPLPREGASEDLNWHATNKTGQCKMQSPPLPAPLPFSSSCIRHSPATSLSLSRSFQCHNTLYLQAVSLLLHANLSRACKLFLLLAFPSYLTRVSNPQPCLSAAATELFLLRANVSRLPARPAEQNKTLLSHTCYKYLYTCTRLLHHPQHLGCQPYVLTAFILLHLSASSMFTTRTGPYGTYS